PAGGSATPPSPRAAAAAGMNGAEQQASAELTTDPSPPHKGKNRLQVTLTTSDGKPLTGAKVNVRFFMVGMPEMGMAAMNATSQLSDRGNGIYKSEGELGPAGTWQCQTTASAGGK